MIGQPTVPYYWHLFNDWDVRITTYLYSGQLGPSFYLRESLCRREEVLSAPRISSFWKRSVSPSFLGVFLCCFGFVSGWVFVFGWVCFVWYWKTPGFLLSPILQHVGITNQRQYVLMTVRASSVHGMSSKKDSPLTEYVAIPSTMASGNGTAV